VITKRKIGGSVASVASSLKRTQGGFKHFFFAHERSRRMSAAYPKINFWDNLIPLRSGLDGPQLAGWTPGPPAKSGLGCLLYADQMIPADDGVSLAADVYTPEVKGRYPAILVLSAYNKELQSSGAPTGTNETGSPSTFTDRGYAHVVIARRGMGRSEGESVIFFNDTDVEDHAQAIA
jgi:uncharacterized protein